MKGLIFNPNETQEVCTFIFKTSWKSYFNNNEKMPGNLLKNLEKSWKYHGILSVRKSGNPANVSYEIQDLRKWTTTNWGRKVRFRKQTAIKRQAFLNF